MSTKWCYMLTWYVLYAGTELCHHKINWKKNPVNIHESQWNKTQTNRKIKKNTMHWKKTSSKHRWHKSCNWMLDTHTYSVLVRLFMKRDILRMWPFFKHKFEDVCHISCKHWKTFTYSHMIHICDIYLLMDFKSDGS